ncbi:MAG TPA: GNAT family N-acetyltransferase, partial [Planctomycetota bacterium]
AVVLASPPDFRIRRSTPGDTREEWTVLMRSWAAAYAHLFDAERIRRVWTGGGHCEMPWAAERVARLGSWLAFRHGRIVGSAGLHLRADGQAELSHLYVLPEHHGRGIGAGLLQVVGDIARARGAPALLVWVLERTPAVDFYRGQGACEVGRATFVVDGQPAPALALRLGLASALR